MSNFECLNTNNNEESMNSTESYVNNDEKCIIETQDVNNFSKNTKETYNLHSVTKGNISEENECGTDENASGTIKNDLSAHSSDIIVPEEQNEKLMLAIQREGKYQKFHHDCQEAESPQVGLSKANHNLISVAKENIGEGGNKSDTTNDFENNTSLNNELLSSQSAPTPFIDNAILCNEVQPQNPQVMTSNLNVVPNPNEFNLVGKKNTSLLNPDILKLSHSADEILGLSDNSIVISNSNAIPQSDSIVSSNYSLSQLQQYISDEDEDSVIEESPIAPLQYRRSNHQIEDSDDSDSSTSSSTSILISDSTSDSDSEDEYENFNKPVSKPIKAKGEMDLNDLPPIEDLAISVPEEECIAVGKIYQIVDQLVIVQANKDTPAYDLDTVLFTQGGKPLGKVFDVMGPVTEPYYCIRFNSKDHIKEKKISLDQTVYVAPKTKYSKFVFLAQLMQLKGSDASWENDLEPPEIYLDYSDDEQEQRAKKKFYRNKKAVSKRDLDPDEPACKKHSAYVQRMNARNLRLSAARSNQNPNRNKGENGNLLWKPNLPSSDTFPSQPRAAAPCHQMFGRPSLFHMRVPQPISPFPGPGRPQFFPPEFSVFNHIQPGQYIQPGPSTSSRGPPFPPPSPPFPRYCGSPGPLTGACASPRPSNGPRMPPFSPPPPYCRLPNNQGINSTPHGWNSSPNPDNPWASPFPPPSLPPRAGPPPMRNAPPPSSISPVPGPFPNNQTVGHPPMRNAPPPSSNSPFPCPPAFPGPFPNRITSPQGPNFNAPTFWVPQPRNQGNFSQNNYNPSVPHSSSRCFDDHDW